VRAFACDNCGLLASFESTSCVRCNAGLGFAWPERELRTFTGDDQPPRCQNAALIDCNWIPATTGGLCFSCARTRTRPADSDAEGITHLARAETAKRRLFFDLGELPLPIDDRLRFDLLSSEHEPVTTGHADGLITLDLSEADDAHRARAKKELGEPYRTLLGHFRHEVGHFYFTVLTEHDDAQLARARETFGDERADYRAALERHYRDGPPPDWEQRHVSAYASMHPAEDWAETFAHLLHIRATIQTAAAFGVTVTGPAAGELDPANVSAPELFQDADLRTLLSDWIPLGYALNEINRSMGQDDLYPFVLTPPVIEKLACVDELVALSAERPAGQPAR
jgi:hypothetical protein